MTVKAEMPTASKVLCDWLQEEGDIPYKRLEVLNDQISNALATWQGYADFFGIKHKEFQNLDAIQDLYDLRNWMNAMRKMVKGEYKPDRPLAHSNTESVA